MMLPKIPLAMPTTAPPPMDQAAPPAPPAEIPGTPPPPKGPPPAKLPEMFMAIKDKVPTEEGGISLNAVKRAQKVYVAEAKKEAQQKSKPMMKSPTEGKWGKA